MFWALAQASQNDGSPLVGNFTAGCVIIKFSPEAYGVETGEHSEL